MTSVSKANRQSWVMGVLVAVVGLSLALVLGVGYKQISDNGARQDDNQQTLQRLRDDLACVETYANAQYQRDSYIQEYLQPRDDAFASLEVAIALGRSDAAVNTLRRVFIQADARYRQVAASQPLSTPPQFVCEGITPDRPPKLNLPTLPTLPHRHPSSPAHPTPTPDSPAVPTGSARPGPPLTRTATRTVPGPSGTRTVTRTPPVPAPSSSSAGRPKGLGDLPIVGPILSPIVCIPATAGIPLLCE